jgi:pyroglutamyl-peptidase
MDIMPGPRHLLCTAPLPRIAAALIAAGFPATISDNAGGYLCNELFYHLITRNATTWCGQTLVLFVHIPPSGTPAPPGDRPIVDSAYLTDLGKTLLETVRQCLP